MVSVASLFAQVLSLISRRDFGKAVRRRDAEKGAKGFSCWDQFVAMLFCQLGGAHSLREICGGLTTALGKLRRCLCTTDLTESPQSGVQMRTRRVCRWRDGTMALRRAASAFLTTGKTFRRTMGYGQLWILQSHLDGSDDVDVAVARKGRVA
jgi:hypothetical protein